MSAQKSSQSDRLDQPHPIKLQMPLALLAELASPIERFVKLSRGAIKGFVDDIIEEIFEFEESI